jgi:hypothetical protein
MAGPIAVIRTRGWTRRAGQRRRKDVSKAVRQREGEINGNIPFCTTFLSAQIGDNYFVPLVSQLLFFNLLILIYFVSLTLSFTFCFFLLISFFLRLFFLS